MAQQIAFDLGLCPQSTVLGVGATEALGAASEWARLACGEGRPEAGADTAEWGVAGLGRRGTRTWNCCPENEGVKVRSTKRRQPGSGVAGAEREGAAGAGAERRALVEETSGGAWRCRGGKSGAEAECARLRRSRRDL